MVGIARFSPCPVEIPLVKNVHDSYSVYFSGSNYMYANAATSALALGTGDFTIEFWVYPNASGAVTLVDFRPTNTNGAYPTLYWDSGGVGFSYYANTADQITSGTSLPYTKQAYRWYHVAVTRSGTTTRLFINGALVGSVTDSTNYICGTSRPSIASNGFSLNSNNATAAISNLRILKGTAAYTAAFTVPKAPLPVTSTTALLIGDNSSITDKSSNALAFTLVGSPTLNSYIPFKRYTHSYGGSAYFDGVGDYTSTAAQSDVAIGTSDYTLEAWINPNVNSATYRTIMTTRDPNQGGNYSANAIWFGLQTGTYQPVLYSSTGLLSSISVAPNSWSHVAVVRQSSTLKIYVNGVLGGTTTDTTNLTAYGSGINVGIHPGGGIPFFGFISGLRFVKTAIYTAAFTPPTAPVTAVSNTLLLMSFDNEGVYDATGNYPLITYGTCAANSATPFGSNAASVYFDGGSGNYLQPPYPPLGLGTSDFTLECWAYPTAIGTVGRLIWDGRPLSTQGVYPALYITVGGVITWYVSSADRIVGSTLSINNWYHIAVSRVSGSTRMFVNGTQVGSTYADTNNYLAAANRPRIGAHGYANDTSNFAGYLSDIRLTRGVGRYSANFTAPKAPFPVGPMIGSSGAATTVDTVRSSYF